MQERYQSINDIFFCSDYIVDGLLYDFKISRQKQQKKTDILFQNYDRGLIRQEDIVEILLSLMECGAQAEKISLHAAAMKNQLILCMTEQRLSKQLGQSNQEGGERDKKKRLKRRLKKYLKKYDGTFYGTDIQEDTQINHRLTEELENVILKGMSVDIKDRYQSMEEFCEALYGAVNERLGF